MPRADGIELASHPASRAMPVILLDAYADVATAVEVMKGGAERSSSRFRKISSA
jgi:FixJ family two-component response regulator